MDALTNVAKVAGPIGAIIAAILYAGSLFSHLDTLLVDHLENAGFATQKSVSDIERKVDIILRQLDDMDKSKHKR